MKNLLVLSTLALAMAGAFASEATGTVTGLLRVTRGDAGPVLARAVLVPRGPVNAVRLRAADARSAVDGVCTFDVRIDEVASSARSGTVTRLFARDRLLAQAGGIDLPARTLATTRLQVGLPAGPTMLKVVLDAEGARPTVAWARVTVDGECTAEPPVTPGGLAWRTLFNAWGYSNYAVTQLRGQDWAGYEPLVALNAALRAVVQARSVSRADYDALMARWNTIAEDADFKALMAAVKPGRPGER